MATLLFGCRCREPCFTDRVDLGFQDQPIELLDRQGQQQVDAAADQRKGIHEGGLLGGVVTFRGDRVRHPPMREDRLTGEHRARLFRAVADGDHEVPRLPIQPGEAARRVAMPFDPALPESLDGVGIHASGGAGPGALGAKPPPALLVQDSLGYLASSRVAGARNSTR